VQRRIRRIEDADDQLLPVHRGGEADAVIDPAIDKALRSFRGDFGAEVPFLNDVPLGDIDVAHNLDGRQELYAELLAKPDGIDHESIDADADVNVVHLRLDVNIGGPAAETDQEDQAQNVDRFADVFLGVGGIGELAAGVDEGDLPIGEGAVGKRIGAFAELAFVFVGRFGSWDGGFFFVLGFITIDDEIGQFGHRGVGGLLARGIAGHAGHGNDQLHLRAADSDDIACRHGGLAAQGFAVQERPVARFQIANAHALGVFFDDAVKPAGHRFLDDQQVGEISPDGQGAGFERNLACSLRILDFEVRAWNGVLGHQCSVITYYMKTR